MHYLVLSVGGEPESCARVSLGSTCTEQVAAAALANDARFTWKPLGLFVTV